MLNHLSNYTPNPHNAISRTVLLFFYLFSSVMVSVAQRPHYRITAALDTSVHIVTGDIEITFTNRSNQSLDSLGLHLWPNAYSSRNTALVRQMLHQGNITLYHARIRDMGGISGLRFSSAGQDIHLSVDDKHIDIGWLRLPKPLLPGETIRFSSPYTLKVPVSFSRLGRTGETYQMTQWYPHLAVLDEQGWHTMPYLDNGEYYNDFADYEVTIQTPPGYMVAGTGILSSSEVTDTQAVWVFNAQNVIDFAWFVSPTFSHKRSIVDVGSGKDVILNIYAETANKDLWERVEFFANRALQFYSEWLGPYPYPQMSVVNTPFSKAGFMEYPMVAQISYTADSVLLDEVIAHEIGHTWLYGILANDERTHPWLDEGLNSFIERRYMETYHPGYDDVVMPSVMSASWSMPQYDALQHIVRFNGHLQPPATDPFWQQPEQYVFSAYVLPMQGLEMILSMKGEEMMKEMFRQYYTDHQFTHVHPEDMQSAFEKACGCDLSWFFDGWLHHAHEVDYRIKKFNARKKEVTLENHGSDLIPVQLSSYKSGHLLMKHWLNGFSGRKIIHLDSKADQVRLYEDVLAINKKWRNHVKPGRLMPRISFLPKIESYTSPALGFTPFFGYNLTDGFMPGVAITSGLIPQQHVKCILAPMYGTLSHEIRGHAEIRYIKDVKAGLFDKMLLSLSLDKFGYNQDTHYQFRDHYVRWSPALAFRMQPGNEHSHLTQWLKYRYVNISQFYGRGINYMEKIFEEEKRNYDVHELSYQLSIKSALYPFSLNTNLQAGQGFLRLNARYKLQLVGKTKDRGLWIYGYGGWLPVYDSPKATVLFSFNGTPSNGFFSRDYMYDEWLGGRNAEGGNYARQVFMKDAGLKTLATIGLGEKWMIGNGMSVALPLKWIHLYLDGALYHGALTDKIERSYSGGLALVLWKDVFEIYLPFLESNDIRQSLTYVVRDRWFERISFQANFKLGNPLNLLDHVQLGY